MNIVLGGLGLIAIHASSFFEPKDVSKATFNIVDYPNATVGLDILIPDKWQDANGEMSNYGGGSKITVMHSSQSWDRHEQECCCNGDVLGSDVGNNTEQCMLQFYEALLTEDVDTERVSVAECWKNRKACMEDVSVVKSKDKIN